MAYETTLSKWQGRITGVGFEPGKFEVKIKGSEGAQMTALSTEAQVNSALKMRSGQVEALTLTNADGTRLLILENEETRVKRPTLDDIFAKWGDTYRALA